MYIVTLPFARDVLNDKTSQILHRCFLNPLGGHEYFVLAADLLEQLDVRGFGQPEDVLPNLLAQDF